MILTTIDGIPLYSTPQEAIDWASQNNVQGYHTHMYQGQTGYMGGASHASAVASLTAPTITSTQTTTSSGGGGGY
jgi:hypothetical protein|tara:strand:+ start:696 stop:920 length:225 start_codon:yes stop_codon:yes gene_type:complete